MTTVKPFPQVWGHRGASAEFPENTMKSFVAAIKEGSHGIESDVHLTKDGRILLFHDQRLDRTSTGTGLIGQQNWTGGMEHVRTKQAPIQPIPLFEEMLDLMMKEGNEHVKFNIDIKVTSEPNKIFPVMAEIIDRYPSALKSRLILGLWHPSFILPSLVHLPSPILRYHIGASISFARTHFWNYCDGFSMLFDCLVDRRGQKFREDCFAAGKALGVWTVNDPKEMVMAAEWGITAILTDKPLVSLDLKTRLATPEARLKTFRELGLNTWLFSWSNWKYYSIVHNFRAKEELDELIRDGGPFEDVAPLPPPEALVAFLEQLARENKKAQASVSLVPDIKERVEESMMIRAAGVRA
ncbi:PLC-like phosphodiesterase [Mrakia frigida]|uniref:PLC-like phosphodiesterase n=1 Tax=Mrakia frigida TaxID=29902 RepID=UPI003FCC1733